MDFRAATGVALEMIRTEPSHMPIANSVESALRIESKGASSATTTSSGFVQMTARSSSTWTVSSVLLVPSVISLMLAPGPLRPKTDCSVRGVTNRVFPGSAGPASTDGAERKTSACDRSIGCCVRCPRVRSDETRCTDQRDRGKADQDSPA